MPTIREAALPDFESRNWIALFAPRGMAEDSINRLNVEINRIVGLPGMRERFADIGAEPMQGTPKQWEVYVRDEVVKWAIVIKAAGVRLE